MSKLYWGGVFFSCLMMCNVLMAAPAAFVENVGQMMDTDRNERTDLKFHIVTHDMEVFFLEDRISYVMRSYPSLESPFYSEVERKDKTENMNVKSYRYDLMFIDANEEMRVKGMGKVISDDRPVVRYYKGENVFKPKHFEKVVYEKVYPGIDLVFYLHEKGIKYDFIVQPGYDPEVIKMAYVGGEEMDLNILESGQLEIIHTLGKVIEEKPKSFLQDGQEVKTTFKLDEGYLSFKLEDYDMLEGVVIDPYLYYTSYIGGSSYEDIAHARGDNFDEHHSVGWTSSSDYPVSSGLLTYTAQFDVILNKFDNNGIRLWTTYFGGNGNDYGHDVAIETLNQDVFIVGGTNSSALPSGINTPYGGEDVFLAKFDNTGSLLWSKYLGGSSDDKAYGITYVPAGAYSERVYITGITESNDFSMLGGFQMSMLSGFRSGFLLELDLGGATMRSTYLSAMDGMVECFGVEPTTDSELILFGHTKSSSLPRALNSYAGNQDFFVARFDPYPATLDLDWTFYIGGSEEEDAYRTHFRIAEDFIFGNGVIHVGGATKSTDIPIETSQSPHPIQGSLNSSGFFDGYYARLEHTPTACNIEFSTYYGGSGDDKFLDFYSLGRSSIYMVGYTESSDLNLSEPPKDFPYQLENNGNKSGMVVNIDNSTVGIDLLNWATYFGEGVELYGVELSTQSSTPNSLYINGNVSGNIETFSNSEQQVREGSQDAFIGVFRFNYCDEIVYDRTYDNQNINSDVLIEDEMVSIVGEVKLTSGVIEIIDSELDVSQCGVLIVESGAQLIIEDSEIRGCKNWQGIIVESGGNVEIKRSVIKDAEVGVMFQAGAVTSQGSLLQNTTFKNNYFHVGIQGVSGAIEIKGCDFEELRPIKGECFYWLENSGNFYRSFSDYENQKMTYYENGTSLLFLQNNFDNQSQTFEEIDGIFSSSSNMDIDVSNNSFTGNFRYGIRLSGHNQSGQTVPIMQNNFLGGFSEEAVFVSNSRELLFFNI